MKPLLPLFISLVILSACSAQAQYFERSFQDDFHNRVTGLRKADNGDLLFTVLNDYYLSLPTTLLYRVDDQGDTLHFHLFRQGQMLDADWLEIPGGYIATGHSFECDFPIPRHLARYNNAGIRLWKNPLEIAGSDTKVPMKLLPGPDSTFWIFRQGLPPVQFNAMGDSIAVSSTLLPLFSGYEKMPNGLLLTYGNAGIRVYSPNLNFIQIGLPGQVILKATVLPDGRIAVLKKDKLLLLSSIFNLEMEAVHVLTAGNYQLDMAASDSSIWLLGTGNPRKLLHYNLNLDLLETKTVGSTMPFQPDFVAAGTQSISLLGEESGNDQVIALRSTNNDAINFSATPDAELLDITMPQSPVDYAYFDQIGEFHIIHFDSLSVIVRNNGPDTLRRVMINSVIESSNYICYVEHQFNKQFTDLHVSPGQTTSLFLGNITQSADFFFPQTSLCFWTTLPNDSLDNNAENNRSCQTFAVITAIETPFVPDLKLKIAPNPAHNICNLSWSAEGGQRAVIRLINMTGQTMFETSTQGNTWQLERQGLPAGMYHVLVTGEDGQRYRGKIIFD